MDKEVELILSKLKIVSEEQERGMYLCIKEHSKLLLDYITNLQEEKENQAHTIKTLLEENGRLKEIVENLTTMTVCGDRKQIKNTAQYKLEDYKSRNEKAIEYIKHSQNYGKEKIIYINGNDLLNILQGSDNNE